MANVMITGGNRGIGFEFVRQYLARKDTVIPTYRDEKRAQEIHALETRGYDSIIPVQLDVKDQASIDACFNTVAEKVGQLDVLINNAGMGDNSLDMTDPYSHKEFGHLKAESLLDIYHVNAVAPIIITQKFVELMEWAEEPKVAYITSQLGSIGRRTESGHYSYNASKAALKMLGRLFSFDLAGMDIMSVLLHPGWVKTSMGGPDAEITVKESVEGMLTVLDNLTPEQNGSFLDWNGEQLVW